MDFYNNMDGNSRPRTKFAEGAGDVTGWTVVVTFRMISIESSQECHTDDSSDSLHSIDSTYDVLNNTGVIDGSV